MNEKLMAKIAKQAQDIKDREAKKGGSFNRLPFWRMLSDESHIRILPAWTDEGFFAAQFWREVGQHWNVAPDQVAPVICPVKTEGMEDECPICDFVDKLKSDKGNIAKKELVKKIRAKKAFFVSMIDLEDPEYTAKDVAAYTGDNDCPFAAGDPKVQVFACGQMCWSPIIGLIHSNKNDITNLTTGRNMFITRIPNSDPYKTKYTAVPELEAVEASVGEDFESPDLTGVGWHKDFGELLILLSDGQASKYAALLPKTLGELPEDTGSDEDMEESDEGSVETDNTPDDLANEMREQLGA